MEIVFITVGGTIDAVQYDFSEGRVIKFGSPAVAEILKTGGVRGNIVVTHDPLHEEAAVLALPPKDSLDMTEVDRCLILILCLLVESTRIVITHGTDTMVETGRLLLKHVQGKTIVITGAMRPYYAEQSDATFNVGTAIGACSSLPPGVYLAAHSRIFPIEQVRKVKETADPHFEELPQQSEKLDVAGAAVHALIQRLIGSLQTDNEQMTVVQIPGEAKTEDGPLHENLVALQEWVQETYYTARYPSGSLEAYLGPMNHTEMFVVKGKAFGIAEDILFASGNELIELKPTAHKIVRRGTTKEWVVLVCRPLSRKETRSVESRIGTLKLPKKTMSSLPALRRQRGILQTIGERLFLRS